MKLVLLTFGILFAVCISAQDASFSTVFFTDVHLKDTKVAEDGFKKAVEKINVLQPDFCISGGDYTGFSKGASMSEVNRVCKTYNTIVDEIKSEVYLAHGNHELLNHYNDSARFEDYFDAKPYYSFNHQNWHFMVLDGAEEKQNEKSYTGYIDSVQTEWIKKDLAQVSEETPIVIVSHVPFQTVFRQRYFDAVKAVSPAIIINNNKEVLELFEKHNLKLVLQGHTHIYEDIKVGGVRFITGGAVSGAWWNGPRFQTNEGFLFLTFKDEDFNVEYINYKLE